MTLAKETKKERHRCPYSKIQKIGSGVPSMSMATHHKYKVRVPKDKICSIRIRLERAPITKQVVLHATLWQSEASAHFPLCENVLPSVPSLL